MVVAETVKEEDWVLIAENVLDCVRDAVDDLESIFVFDGLLVVYKLAEPAFDAEEEEVDDTDFDTLLIAV